MPTTYTDQFFVMDPYSPPPAGTFVPAVVFDLVDQTNDNDIDAFDGDTVDGIDISRSYPGDTVTLDISGVGQVTYTGITFYLADGREVFTPTDGQVLQSGTLVSATGVTTQGPLNIDDMGPPCFVTGTLIQTPTGRRPIEDLKVGDAVMTLDRGVQTINWIGTRQIDGQGPFAPIRFETGAVGNDRPLLVSPQHRVLISGWKAEMFYGASEVLVAAKHLVNGHNITVAPMGEVTYHHFLCDQHELVWSDGCLTESFFPGDIMMREDTPLYEELTTLFPELASGASDVIAQTARRVLRGFEAAVLQPV